MHCCHINGSIFLYIYIHNTVAKRPPRDPPQQFCIASWEIQGLSIFPLYKAAVHCSRRSCGAHQTGLGGLKLLVDLLVGVLLPRGGRASAARHGRGFETSSCLPEHPLAEHSHISLLPEPHYVQCWYKCVCSSLKADGGSADKSRNTEIFAPLNVLLNIWCYFLAVTLECVFM